MDNNIPEKSIITDLIMKIAPPLILSIMTKTASDYKRGIRMSLFTHIAVIVLAGCGAIIGYWVTRWLNWTEYKMTLTIFFFGIFADKGFEYIFSKTFLNNMFNSLQDIFIQNMTMIINKLKK